MFEKPVADYPLGLEQSDMLRGALLSEKSGRPKVERVFELALGEKVSPHRDVIHTIEPKLPKDLLRKALYITGLKTKEILTRTLEIKLTKEKDINAVLAFQAEPILPYPIEQAILDKIVLFKDESGSQLSLFSVRKDHLQAHIDSFNDLNIEPEVISCQPMALATFSKHYTALQGLFFVLHLGVDEAAILLVEEGKLFACYSIPGILQLKLLQGDIDFMHLDDSPLLKAAESLLLDISKSLYALTKQAKGQEIASLLVTGEGASLGNLAEWICFRLKKEFIEPSAPWDPSITTKELKRYAVAIGLALQGLNKSTPRVNFRQSEFVYPYPWKRIKKPLALYIFSSIFIAFLLFLAGKQHNTSQLNSARSQYKNLLMIRGIEHEEVEKIGEAQGEEMKAAEELSAEEISVRVEKIEREIEKTTTTFPLQPNIANVSDVLAWLCTHPQVVTTDEKGQKKALLEIENFTYNMIKKPDRSKPREHYQVKINIELSSKEAKWAREFHDALVAPNEFVDPKSEIKWSASQGRYRTSFFLKDKTYYP